MSLRSKLLVLAAIALLAVLAGYAFSIALLVHQQPGGELFRVLALGTTVGWPPGPFLRVFLPSLGAGALAAALAARGRVTQLGGHRVGPIARATVATAPMLASPLALAQDDVVRRETLLALCIGATAAAGVYLFAAERDAAEGEGRISSSAWRDGAAVLAGMTAHAVIFCFLEIQRDAALWSATVDLGIFKEALWNTLHGRLLYSPTVGYSFLGEHFSPILLLLVPFYALSPTSATLLIAQTLAVSASAWPIFRLARLQGLSRALATVVALSMLFAPTMHTALMYDFHMDLLGVPALAWAILAAHERRFVALGIAATALCMVKEDAFIALSGVALFMYVDDPQRRKIAPAVLAGAAIAYCAVAIVVFIHHFGPPPGVPTYMGDDTGGGYKFMRNFNHLRMPGGPLRALLAMPVRYALWMVTQDRLTTILVFIVPLLGAPLFAGIRSVVMAPLVLVLLSDNPEINTLHYHYPAIQHPGVYAAGVFGIATWLARATETRRAALDRGLVAGVAVASLALVGLHPASMFARTQSQDPRRVTPSVRDAVALMNRVPRDAAVSASSFGGARFSNRERLWMFPRGMDVADFAFVDLQRPAWPVNVEGRDAAIVGALRSGVFGAVAWRSGSVLLERGASTDQNREAVRELFLHRSYEVEGTEDTDFPNDVERDATASDGYARVYRPTDPRAGTWLLFGPYLHLPAGRFRVHFRLRAEPTGFQGDIGRVDVFSDGTTLADHALAPEDFPSPAWQDVALLFSSGARSRLEFRIRVGHGAVLGADRVWLEPVDDENPMLSSMGF